MGIFLIMEYFDMEISLKMKIRYYKKVSNLLFAKLLSLNSQIFDFI